MGKATGLGKPGQPKELLDLRPVAVVAAGGRGGQAFAQRRIPDQPLEARHDAINPHGRDEAVDAVLQLASGGGEPGDEDGLRPLE